MLTSMSWVPKGAMNPVPVRSGDNSNVVRAKLRQQDPDAGAEHGGPSGHLNHDENRGGNDDDVSSDDGVPFVSGGVGDTVLEQVESDDEEELSDTRFKETDLVFVAASADAEQPRLEVYVYDEPEDSVYVHHDVEVAAFPLSTAWCTSGAASLCAVGTMRPFVEIWNLDVMDAVEPCGVLGGCVRAEDNYRRHIKPRMLQPDSHQQAVLSVRWNTTAQHILASGSADGTIKLWDMTQGSCVGTFAEQEKVQSLDWHREEANLLLSGGFDATAVLRDCRAPSQTTLRFATGGVVEHVEFAPPGGAALLYASTSAGAWMSFDARASAAPLWQVPVHGEDTTFACSPHINGLLATGGKDGMISLWDGRDYAQPPRLIVSRSYRTGSVLSLAFHPNSPHILGACGSRGEPLVYTTSADIQNVFQ